jgi:hypothetical protein
MLLFPWVRFLVQYLRPACSIDHLYSLDPGSGVLLFSSHGDYTAQILMYVFSPGYLADFGLILSAVDTAVVRHSTKKVSVGEAS